MSTNLKQLPTNYEDFGNLFIDLHKQTPPAHDTSSLFSNDLLYVIINDMILYDFISYFFNNKFEQIMRLRVNFQLLKMQT